MGRNVELEALVDSKTLFNFIAKDGSTVERRLKIDVMALRQSYENVELHRLAWIQVSDNPADALKKCVLSDKSQ